LHLRSDCDQDKYAKSQDQAKHLLQVSFTGTV